MAACKSGPFRIGKPQRYPIFGRSFAGAPDRDGGGLKIDQSYPHIVMSCLGKTHLTSGNRLSPAFLGLFKN
jgi:hypothetical protein